MHNELEKREKRIYKYSLALPLIAPVICLLVTPHDLDSLYEPIAKILMAFVFSGLVGGIPYAILAIGLLVWMWNKDIRQIRKALLLSPLLLIPIFMGVLLIYVLMYVAVNRTWEQSIMGGAYMLGLFCLYILAFGYFYVLLVFGLARLVRRTSLP